MFTGTFVHLFIFTCTFQISTGDSDPQPGLPPRAGLQFLLDPRAASSPHSGPCIMAEQRILGQQPSLHKPPPHRPSDSAGRKASGPAPSPLQEQMMLRACPPAWRACPQPWAGPADRSPAIRASADRTQVQQGHVWAARGHPKTLLCSENKDPKTRTGRGGEPSRAPGGREQRDAGLYLLTSAALTHLPAERTEGGWSVPG